MLINDKIDVNTKEFRLSSLLYCGSVNNPIGLWIVNHVAKLFYPVERKSNFVCSSRKQIRITRKRFTI